MLVGHDVVLDMILSQRVVWISGAVRSGKTAIAFKLAQELLERFRFRYLLSNCDSVWTDSVGDVVLRDGFYLDAVIIYDELGMFSWAGGSRTFAPFVGKLNCVVLGPSVEPPPRHFYRLEIRRIFNFMPFGVPVWLYRWRVPPPRGERGVKQPSGLFWWLNPKEIYGVYDSSQLIADDAGISSYIWRLYEQRSGKGRVGQILDLEEIKTAIEAIQD